METIPNQKSSPRNSSLRKALIVVGSLLGVALLAVAFMGGFFLGQARGNNEREQLAFNKRQLTENLDQPLRDRPLLQNVPEQLKQRFKEHGLRGTVIEIEEGTILVDTPNGARTVAINEQTKFFQGDDKIAASLEDIKVGTPILVLSRGQKPPLKPLGDPANGDTGDPSTTQPVPPDGGPGAALVADVIIINPAKAPKGDQVVPQP